MALHYRVELKRNLCQRDLCIDIDQHKPALFYFLAVDARINPG